MGDLDTDGEPVEPESSADEAGGDSRTDAEPPPLRETYPELCAELVRLLAVEGLSDLSICAHDLRIVAPCRCGDDFCQSFYTAPPPNGAYGPGHRNVVLAPDQGMIVLDVVGGRIMFVEVIDYPPLRDVSEMPPVS